MKKDIYLKKYLKTKGIAIRYGIDLNFFDSIFVENYKKSENYIKKLIINDAIISENNNHYTKDDMINCLNDLNKNERLILNLILDDYSYYDISKFLKSNVEEIKNVYLNTINKLKKNEKVISYFSSDNIISKCKEPII